MNEQNFFTHEYWMEKALNEARAAAEEGEIPVGAVIVRDNRIIGRGHNRREKLNDPTAHAEIIAITAAAETLGSWRLTDCTLYVTMEPCPMCAGAIVNSRVPTLVYGIKDSRAGAVDSLYHLCEDPRLNHRALVFSGILQDSIMNLVNQFFSELRNE